MLPFLSLLVSFCFRVDFFAKMRAVQEFMVEQNLSRALMTRTENYLAMLWRVNRYFTKTV